MSTPPEIAQWLDLCVAAGETHRVDPYLLAALLDRESRGGLALQPVGPDGTGDWAPRHGVKYRGDIRYRFWGELPVEQNGKQVFLAHYMPADGKGWGRGLFQIDYAAWADFVDSGDWRDPAKCADFAAKLLARLIGRFGDEICGIAAYNAGEGVVARELEELTDPKTEPAKLRALDWVTEGQNYVSDVLRRRSKFLAGPTQPIEQPKETA